jgi:N-acetylglutamate synthase-like GNAT family acetyltransferase
MADLTIAKAKSKDFPYIKEKIKNYLLDGNDMHWRQFFVTRFKDKPVAFGRVIDHELFYEIASLGVDYYHRGKGIGKKMLTYLVREARKRDARKPIYGVTHVAKFVSACGFFRVKKDYPKYLDKKRKSCHLDQSKICVMKWGRR